MRVSGQFYFFTKRFHTHKKHKNAYKRTKTKKAVLNALKKHLRGRKLLVRLFAFLCFLCAFCVQNKEGSILIRIKNIWEEENRLLTICAFCVYKKHLSESRLFCVFVLFVLFVRVKSFREKKTKQKIPKKHLDTLNYITTK